MSTRLVADEAERPGIDLHLDGFFAPSIGHMLKSEGKLWKFLSLTVPVNRDSHPREFLFVVSAIPFEIRWLYTPRPAIPVRWK